MKLSPTTLIFNVAHTHSVQFIFLKYHSKLHLILHVLYSELMFLEA